MGRISNLVNNPDDHATACAGQSASGRRQNTPAAPHGRTGTGGTTSQEAGAILERALARQNNMTFSAVAGKGGTTQKIFQQANPDGTSYKKIETSNPDGENTIFLRNRQGEFSIRSGTGVAVKIDFPAGRPDFIEYSQFKMQSLQHNGRPCVNISQQIPGNEKTFKAFLDSVPTDLKKRLGKDGLIDSFKNKGHHLIIYCIDPESLFIYSKSYYSFDGKLQMKTQYDNVDFSPEFSSDFFDLPIGIRIESAPNVTAIIDKDIRLSPKRHAGK